MSRSVPHYSRDWLDAYRNRRQAIEARNAAQTATSPKLRAKRLVPYTPAKCARVERGVPPDDHGEFFAN